MENKRYTQQDVDIAKMAFQVDNIEKSVKAMSSKLDAEYVTKGEMEILNLKHDQLQKQADFTQKIVFGVIGLIAVAVIGAIINLVIIK